MPRLFRLVVAAGFMVAGPVAFANGLYLKLAPGTPPAAGGAGSVTLTLQAVATHDFRLPQTPLFLVDDGSGMKVANEVQPTPIDVPETVKVTPEKKFTGSWQLSLPPGSYKVKVRYKLADRTVESNAVKVQVPAPASK